MEFEGSAVLIWVQGENMYRFETIFICSFGYASKGSWCISKQCNCVGKYNPTVLLI